MQAKNLAIHRQNLEPLKVPYPRSDEIMQNDAELQAELRALHTADGKATVYNNEKGLEAKRDAIDLALDFPQTLAVVSRIPVAQAVPNHDDDLNREKAFYTQAQAAVAIARQKLETMKVPYLRPDDYYAEMLKSDGHMQRIRDTLLFEERKMAAFQRRKKAQEHKKFGKQLNAEKIKNKAAEKRMAIDAISQIRKRRKNNGGGVFDVDVAVEQATTQSYQVGGRQGGRGGNRGGRGGNRGGRGGRRGGRGGKRLGKGRRQKMRRG